MKTVSKKLLSLMLVALLLVSALPFQAFADAHDGNNPAHTLGEWQHNSTKHWQECGKADCDEAGNKLNKNYHSFDSNGICTVCNYACTHGNAAADPSTAIAATCVNGGKAADVICPDCHKVVTTGAATPATGVHSPATGVCTVCGNVSLGAEKNLVLSASANGGTVNGAASMTVAVKVGAAISVLPDAVNSGKTFKGWFIAGTNTQVFAGSTYDGSYTELEARFDDVVYTLTVRRTLNGDSSTAKTIYTANVAAGTSVLNYLNTQVYSAVTAELALTPGYTWENNYWKDFSGTQPLTSQADMMNQAQTVFVNFKANAYTLYFNANGGTVAPASKPVVFGQKVGTLPTPTKSGAVFQGWKDINGVVYTADTIYSIAGDTTLTAVWGDEALVLLRIYINGDFTSCNRIVVMDGFVKNNNVSRDDVVSVVQKYYSASSGYLNIAGLFDDSTWASYKANPGKAGTPNIAIANNGTPNNIYVMVTNASTGSTIVNGNGNNNNGYYTGTNGNGSTGGYNYNYNTNTNGTGGYNYNYNTGSNPKTGDTAMIEAAATVMVLAAAALVTATSLHKKKVI